MSTDVTMVRIYLTEAEKLLNMIMGYLHDEIRIKGVTVFRAISGFGESGAMHSSQLLTMSLDLPLVIEFFDDPKTVEKALTHLQTLVDPAHVVYWQAKMSGASKPC